MPRALAGITAAREGQVSEVTLSAESVQAIAEAVAERLRAQPAEPELIDAAEVARRFNLSRDYVYEHADKLGAVRLGDGPRARLRFDPRVVSEAMASFTPQPAERRRPRRSRAGIPLLPIGGKR